MKILSVTLALSLLLIACSSQDKTEAAPATRPATADPQTRPAPAPASAATDSLIFERTIARATSEQLDTLPIGEIVVRVGQWFVGSPYAPATLEQPGAERLVINLREFDCVTYVENMLAFARILRARRTDFASFKQELAAIRYRDGALNGYPSRLHYFSEWIANNDAKGIVRNETPTLGVVDPEPISFMTAHRDAYRQLADSAVFAQIGEMEKRLSAAKRFMIPESQIAARAAQIQNGDVIAATSSLKGLDVAHTGIAIWQGDRLHLMHAPLVGTRVEISEAPLADRIRAIDKQDGIMVARPL